MKTKRMSQTSNTSGKCAREPPPPVVKGHYKTDLGRCPVGDGVQYQGMGDPLVNRAAKGETR